MATIVLQVAAGALFGGFLGPVGATLGTAAGAMAGYMIDRALLSGSQHYEGPRLAAARPFSAEDGAPLPRLYGTVRTGGTLIWATRFEETSRTERQGLKGGPKYTTYSYFANAAFALCEGEIAGVRRIWADGREIDRTKVEIRVHNGSEEQLTDPLIEAKQGVGNTPAYRGTAYVVIDRIPIDDYGRRIPQFQFEVMRPVGTLHKQIRSVALIPGATEYGLSPTPVDVATAPGEETVVNRNTLLAASDLEASLDELQMLFPNLETVSLVVSWFGTDLRAGECRIKPMVATPGKRNFPEMWEEWWGKMGIPAMLFSPWLEGEHSAPWVVSGNRRYEAQTVSTTSSGAAYGGTPSDKTVLEAIRAIRNRNLKVWLYPFVMMDIPEGNGLPDPGGEAVQPAYPWRGRVTCFPAIGRPGSADKTNAARNQISAFLGNAQPSQFEFSDGTGGPLGLFETDVTVEFQGAPDDWGYRRFLLHYARLAAAAGGVDGFLIGSELRGLTVLRDEKGKFPFVEALRRMAGEVREALGPRTIITYAADWTEYFGHQPTDGSGDVLFHLDELWADPEIDVIGIDNYMPLSDWRDEDCAGGNPDGFSGPYDAEGLEAALSSGEGFEWYYASAGDRALRLRSPISDDAYGKHWVFRYKDLAGWWSNPHYNRHGGIEAGAPTAWVPRSKPVIFTELGCAAVDKGPNQPNAFPDRKSSEGTLPYFSNGSRSDLAQHRFLQAHYAHWGQAGPENPVSEVYGGPMVQPENIAIWAWDARPFPAFPLRSDLWGDGDNWACGHWLNGRVNGTTAADLIDAVLADHGIPSADTQMADGTVAGYVVSNPSTARAALEPLLDLFGIGARETAGELAFYSLGRHVGAAPIARDLVLAPDAPVVERIREPDHLLSAELHVDFRDQMKEHQSATSLARHSGARGKKRSFLSFPGVLTASVAGAQAEEWLRRQWVGRERISFATAMTERGIHPGSLLRLPEDERGAEYVVTEIEEGIVRAIKAQRVKRAAPPSAIVERSPVGTKAEIAARPFALMMDLPWLAGMQMPEEGLKIAARASPWRQQVVLSSPDDDGFDLRTTLARPATMGFLREALGVGFEGRFDHKASILVQLLQGELQSLSRMHVLGGGNAAAVFSAVGIWEVVQFATAEEVEPSLWRLTGLLRGQAGTGDAMLAGAPQGAGFVLLDHAVRPAGLGVGEIGLPRNWRIGPAGEETGSDRFLQFSTSGGVRAQRPLSPVHLRARRRPNGDWVFSWVRRERIDADAWEVSETPISEDREAYRIDVASAAGVPLRSVAVEEPFWIYDADLLAGDFPAAGSRVEVTVAQKSAAVGAGLPARIFLEV
ncbi:phage host specificity protein [Nitratireductor indicus C115]|uniref:Phage host specificity protein n=1 Tax=Nitratireductor indicus C115 TaxID=1231190 RepID=K2NSB9_9HYPH|nr:glycoside hydrolase/phage tail family protein [Nitratireductor indicus]EKF40644.1 phage host specificity protein [Nitratireductor indicus C115]SFQ43474.1 Putative phage tail protein [Nitratireductor indicus]